MNNRKCLLCEEPLKGRADQKYCSDACRNAYNNQKVGNTNRYMRKVNRILKQNHTILEKLNPKGRTQIQKNTLTNKGFKYNYFTHILKLDNGRNCYFCYDQGIFSINKNQYYLVKKDIDE